MVVPRHLLGRGAGDQRADLSPGERQASRLVGWALYTLIAFIVLSTAASLIFRVHPEASALGIAVTVSVLPIMAVLWRWR